MVQPNKNFSLKLDMYDPVGEKDDTVEIGVSNLKKQLEDITLKDKREESIKLFLNFIWSCIFS